MSLLKLHKWYVAYLVCQDGFYNATCSAKCGHCIREEICEKHDGTCISGCSQNFKPPLCQGMM